MSIIQNIACPACRAVGHDAQGTNMIVFEDGSKFCNRAHWHADGLNYYESADGSSPITDAEITGLIKYTPKQFHELEAAGKLADPKIRAIALAGMRGQDRFAVANDDEKAAMLENQRLDKGYFDQLKIKNLVTRHINGIVAKLYNVRVGLDPDGKVSRHYYPVYSLEDGSWKGAKCRNLPKDFRYGHLGWMWGDNQLFGMHTLQTILESGAYRHTLTLVGGELDALSAQQMLMASRQPGKFKDALFHVWSPTKGECALQEIINNKAEIAKFKKVILCFDDDDTGKRFTTQVARMFPGKCFKLQLPPGCKDPNDALKQDRAQEFISAWFNPIDALAGGVLSGASKYREKAKFQPAMGLSWAWPGLDPVTYGMRLNFLSVWGGGTGCGKTKCTKTIVSHMINDHKVPVVVIYLEESPDKTLRSFAGELINKELTAPPINDPDDPEYSKMRDYTLDEANAAIDSICDSGMLMIGDLEGRKDVDSVIEVLEEGLALGYRYFVIDNLTAFVHKDARGDDTVGTAFAIDQTMKRLGSFKDENPVHVMLLSHLNRPAKDRKPHELGGIVKLNDFRGSGSITFWANAVFGIERNTASEDEDERLMTKIRCLKNRDVGYKNGSIINLRFDMDTGKLLECSERQFDDGTEKETNIEEF